MRALSRICLGLAAFLLVAGLVYALTAHEPSGATGLLIGSATFGFLALITHRATADEDDLAEGPHDEAEAVVSPTIWPFGFAISAIVVALGLIVEKWILVPAAAGLAVCAAGWLRDVARSHTRAH